MRVVFAGTPSVALPSLDALLASDHDVIAVITRPDAPAGRGRRTTAGPVAERARDAGVEVLTPASPKDPEFQQRLTDLAPDCIPVVAYGALVPAVLLDVPRYGWVNLHFSLLPAWRGAAPVQHAVLHGDEITGASTFRLEAGLDTGPVYGVVTERIRPIDTSGAVLERLAVSGATLLLATLDGISSGECAPVPQPIEGISLAPKLSVDDVRVDWSAPAMRVDRLVRAATPAPGAWTTFRDKRLKLGPVVITDQQPDADLLAPGSLRVDGGAVLVGTADRAVRLTGVQPEGKARMAAVDWARGVRLTDDDRLL
ncbi:MAG TPA: methionyl-tRNA formyltransferase [Mycobacteriales bacterium]|nr:methionyl-tRNA formyltransferase [Mycobacteriales bacterium]